jgi:3-oxoadipate enol-lactonase
MKQLLAGRDIGYDDRGRGDAVVLLHPFPLDRRIWAGVGDALAARHRVIAVDARGFGESAPSARFSIDELAADLEALLDTLGVQRVALLGMSMGGYAALAFAARAGARLERLVLADTRAAADTPEVRRKRDEAIALCRRPDGGAAAYLAGSLGRLLSPAAPPALVAHVRGRAEDRPGHLVAGLEALRDRPDRTAVLADIACPTLVLCGADDQVTPATEMRAMAAAIPDARFVALADAGHLSHLEAPGAFERAVSAFLTGGTER